VFCKKCGYDKKLDVLDAPSRHCGRCCKIKSRENFYYCSATKDKLSSYCKDCTVEVNGKHRKKSRETKPFFIRHTQLKASAKAQGVPFSLSAEYLESIWTGRCAIFGTPVDIKTPRNTPMSPEVDKHIPELGYVEGNVSWVCHRANRIKDNATVEELEAVLKFVKEKRSVPNKG
jgi:hypothetical protein